MLSSISIDQHCGIVHVRSGVCLLQHRLSQLWKATLLERIIRFYWVADCNVCSQLIIRWMPMDLNGTFIFSSWSMYPVVLYFVLGWQGMFTSRNEIVAALSTRKWKVTRLTGIKASQRDWLSTRKRFWAVGQCFSSGTVPRTGKILCASVWCHHMNVAADWCRPMVWWLRNTDMGMLRDREPRGKEAGGKVQSREWTEERGERAEVIGDWDKKGLLREGTQKKEPLKL